MKSESASYRAAGVDITAGYKAVELMKKHVQRTVQEVASSFTRTHSPPQVLQILSYISHSPILLYI